MHYSFGRVRQDTWEFDNHARKFASVRGRSRRARRQRSAEATKASGFQVSARASQLGAGLAQPGGCQPVFLRIAPRVCFLCSRKGGGDSSETYPAEFIRDNLLIQTNTIDSAYRQGATKFLFLGSSCVYPKHAPQPIPESALLTGALEPTNEWYAIAKIAGLKMCQAYRKQYGFNAISAMPTNLYGPGDNFDLENSHVLPALIRKFHEAKEQGRDQVVVWGTGAPRREFLHVDDLAEACVHLMQNYESADLINVGWGQDVSIRELADLVAQVVGYTGRVVFDTTKPDGTPRKLLETSRINGLGWRPRIELKQGIEDTYGWFRTHLNEVRA
jgi:GDP-L-fucose synthase